VFDFSTLVAQGMAEGAVKNAATPPPRSPTAGGRRKVKAGRRAGKIPPQAANSPSQEDVLGIVGQGRHPHDWHPKLWNMLPGKAAERGVRTEAQEHDFGDEIAESTPTSLLLSL